MKVLASHAIKGGVGKTAAAVNLAFLAANEGARTLIWDLDPQAAASFYFRVHAKVKGGGKKLLRGRRDLADAIKATDHANLDLLPADFSYRKLDLILTRMSRPEKVLSKRLKPLREEYDYVFLDCPPGISLATESIFQAADALLVPVIPTTLSVRTLLQLVDFLGRHDKYNRRDTRLLPYFCMCDRRKRMHRNIMDAPIDPRVRMLPSAIPLSSDIERMGVARMPTTAYAPNSAAALAFRSLWADIRQQL